MIINYWSLTGVVFIVVSAILGASRFEALDGGGNRENKSFDGAVNSITLFGAAMFLIMLLMVSCFDLLEPIDGFLARVESRHPDEESLLLLLAVAVGMAVAYWGLLRLTVYLSGRIKCMCIEVQEFVRQRRARKAHERLIRDLKAAIWQTQLESRCQQKHADDVAKAASRESRGEDVVANAAKARSRRSNIIEFRRREEAL